MKRFLLVFSLVTVLSFNHSNNAIQAQGININLNIGNQPAWGPVGYDYAAYYYLPDIGVYYDVNRNYFYYPDRGAWRSARYLPYSYGQYDLYGMYKVVINQPNPWVYNDYYHREYGRYRGNRSQVIILNSPDRRYDRVRYNRVDWVNPGRPGRYPNYHNQHPGYGRPGNNGSHHNGGGNHNRPETNRPKPNDKYSGNNDRHHSSHRNDQFSKPPRSSQNRVVRGSDRSSNTADRSSTFESNGRTSNLGRSSNSR